MAVAALLALGLGRGAYAATLTVINTNDSGAGSLRQAIADAAAGDTIDFAAGLSGQTITLTTGELFVAKNLTITGPAGGITVDGNNASRVFDISAGTVKMSDLTVASGNGANLGGGILNYGSLTLTNSTISGNTTAIIGGGIFNSGSTLILTNSTVSGNSAGEGGGGIGNDASQGTVLTVTNSTVSGNRAVGGGGIFNSGTLTLTNSTVSSNTATGGGGILNYRFGTLVVASSTISGNVASAGGGISNYMGVPMTLTNSTISGNNATEGGGIFNGGSATLKNSTVSLNGGGQGGGIWNDSTGTLNLTSSIVATQTSGGDCLNNFSIIHSFGFNLDSDGTCSLTATGDLQNTNPMLNPLALNPPGSTQTQALQIGSPAIDHIPPGVNGCGTTISTDQRGVSRPQGSGCDIGAYEFMPPPTPAPVGGIVELLHSGSGGGSGSPTLPIAVAGGAVLAAMFSGWYIARRRLR
jgi:hypothetical protein